MSIIGNPLILPSGGGGGGLNGNWMGNNPTLMTGTGWSYSTTIYLKDTSYPTWTPSTTAATILAAGSTPVLEIPVTISGGYDYIILCKMDVAVAFLSGATLKNTPFRFIRIGAFECYSYPNTYLTFVSGSPGSLTSASSTRYQLFYYNSSGVMSCASASYGPAHASTAASISSTIGSGTATHKISLPAIQARCSSTYFATGRAAEVDANNTTIKFDYSVYRIDAMTGLNGKLYYEIGNILNNPL